MSTPPRQPLRQGDSDILAGRMSTPPAPPRRGPFPDVPPPSKPSEAAERRRQPSHAGIPGAEGKQPAQFMALLGGALAAGVLAFLYFTLLNRPGTDVPARPGVILLFTVACITLCVLAVFLRLFRDLTFVSEGAHSSWANWASGLLLMIVLLVVIKVFNHVGAPPYDLVDDLAVVTSTLMAGGAAYLLLHALAYQPKPRYGPDTDPMAVLSGFTYGGLAGFVYFLFLDSPFDRDPGVVTPVLAVSIVGIIVAGLVILFHRLDSTYFAPPWATKQRMNVISGMLLVILLFIYLNAWLSFYRPPYDSWDPIRIMSTSGITLLATWTGVRGLAE